MIRGRLVGRADKPVRTRTPKVVAGAKRTMIVTGTVVFRIVAFIFIQAAAWPARMWRNGAGCGVSRRGLKNLPRKRIRS